MREYFEALLQSMPEGYFAHIWISRLMFDSFGEIALNEKGQQKMENLTFWVPDAVRAQECCEKALNQKTPTADDGWNVYLGRGISREDRGKHKRVRNSDADGILDFCLDLDYGSDGHKEQGYPPTQADVLRLLDKVRAKGLPVTTVVDSGHGIQVRIRLKDPWLLQTDAERTEARVMSRRLHNLVQEVWTSEGYNHDSIIDLGRVLRVPGTVNYKVQGKPVPVTLLTEPDKQACCTLEELDALLPQLDKTGRQVVKAHESCDIHGIVLDPQAEPDKSRLQELTESDKTVRDALKGGAHAMDAKGQPFKSTSERDLSVATRAASRGWSGQEIADLIIYIRRNNQEDLKLDRQRRYLGTIEKALAAVMPSYDCKASEVMAKHDAGGEVTDEERDCLLDAISGILLLSDEQKIDKITKFRIDHDKTIYSVAMKNGKEVEVAGINSFKSKSSLIGKFGDQAGVYLSLSKADKLDILPKLVLAACVDEDLGIESSPEARIRRDLREYLTTHSIYTDADTAFTGMQPYYDKAEGLIWFKAEQMFKALGYDDSTRYRASRAFKRIGVEVNKTKRLSGGAFPKMHRTKIGRVFDQSEIAKLRLLDAAQA